MLKPKPVERESILHYRDIIKYIEDKYKINVRDYAGHFVTKDKPYLDFWHYLDNKWEEQLNSNGCEVYLNLEEWLGAPETPDWVKEILLKIYDEFKEYIDDHGGFYVYVSW
jgi:hypothetical protein